VGFRVGRLLGGWLLRAAVLALPLHALAVSDPLVQKRQGYNDALQALERQRWDDYHQLRSALDDYALAIYLDYYQLSRQAHRVRPPEVNRFLQRSQDSPLPNRFLTVYLNQIGRAGRWGDFLEVMPREPNSIVLKCYYFRALLAEGDRQSAWEGAQRLWVYGKSRPDECDPLFDAWQASGELTDDIVWARLLEAFEERQRSLMRYVASKGSDDLQPWSDKLLRVYANPSVLARESLPADAAYSADIASYGVAHLSRYSPEKALDQWREYQSRLDFSPQQVRHAEYAIAQRSLFARTAAHVDWLHGAMARLGDDTLVGIRLRWALAEADRAAFEKALPLLSAAEREEGVWRYWQALAMEQRGAGAQARELLEALSTERSYYGFLAADRLDRPYNFNHRALAPADAVQLRRLPALARIEELHFHDEELLAHSEWHNLLSGTEDAERQQELAALAADQGWYRMAIDAASRARAWDALDVRFPMPYRSVFDSHAQTQQVPSTELMAIARRESAFFPRARSPVGALGLMQIMPATGRQVASSVGVPHNTTALYDVEHNVLLGSTYYRQLLDRFGGNRVFALTAYNAGPHRVDRWRNRAGEGVSVERWIETIPYRETRNYVQAVLSYNVVFRYLMGDTAPLLSPAERGASY